MAQLLLLLFAVAACAWICHPLASGSVTPSTNGAELHELAGAARRRSFPFGRADRQRLSLSYLESMWHTSLGKELDCASSGREEAFLATLDAEWARLTTDADDASKLRSPFLVCTDRHPAVIRGLEVLLHRVRPQLVYSRGDTACLVAGIRLDDIDAVMAAEGIHAIEPLPHPAKLSRNLYATLDPLDQRGESLLEGTKSPESQLRQTSKAEKQNFSDPWHFSPLEIRFNHGEDLPTDLVISLTPGAWEPRLVRTWMQHLTSFVSTRSLWDEHLRELFLWTRSVPKNFVANGAGRREGGLRAGHNVSDEASSNNRGLIAAHGLSGTASLWEQAAARSSEDGACDLGRLGAFLDDRRDSAQRGRQGLLRVGVGRSGWKNVVPRDGEMRDRLVLPGAGLLGKTAGDNVHCLLTVLAYLATRPEVAYVDDIPQVIPFNLEAAWITQSGRETSYPMWDRGIDGRTEIIAVADSGLDMNSCFFKEDKGGTNIECSTYSSPVYDLNKRKVVQYVGYADCVDVSHGHGTHVAGSAAGALSETSPGEHFGDGAGFRSKLAIFDMGNADGYLMTPTNLQTQMLQPPYDVGARVSSNSWGAVRMTYTSLDRQMDSFAFQRPDMVIVVAAGNCGDASSGCQYQGVDVNGAGSILSPALAKNVITVGASEASPSVAGITNNMDNVAYFSSQGPTVDDGRIKPDVIAPGYHLFSASANPEGDESCGIEGMAGTSMATPIVAGSAAMVRQYFVQGWYPTGQATPSDIFNPSNALVKATLVASGTAMASYESSLGTTTILSSPPDGIQGFGRILLDSVLNLHGSVDLYVEDAIEMSHGEEHSYTVEMGRSSVSSMDGSMKVAMVWMEPAAAVASVSPVFNDLDLLVVGYKGTSGTTFYPNNLAAKDSDNTVEVVSIPGADSFDSFQITVTGATVTTDDLPYYALVVVGGVASDYSVTSSRGRSWFVRWEMELEGIPVTQAATVAFEAGLAAAISSETGNYTLENSTVLVKIDRSETATGDDVDRSSSVSVEISVASEADGYAVVTYVNAVAEGSSASADEGLAAALNSALQSRTTEDCRCVATDNGGYDCSACEEGEAFSTVESIATAQGNYNLFSVEGSGRSPVSVLGLVAADTRDDGVWDDFPGGRGIRGVLRTDNYLHVAAVVLTIVIFTSICGCMLHWSSKYSDPVSQGPGILSFDSHEFDEIFGDGSKPRTPPRSRSPTAGCKEDRCWGSPQPGLVGGSSPRRRAPTPITTPGHIWHTPDNDTV